MMWEMWFGKSVLTGRRREDIYRRIKDEHYRPQIEAIRPKFEANSLRM